MALIKRLDAKEIAAPKQQGPVEATYSCFELDGERFFQIDTYGSPDRADPGKRSQSLRLDKEAAAQLVDLLNTHFAK